MAILGLLLFAAATTLGVEIAVSNRGGIPIEAFGTTYHVNVAVVFLTGALLACVALLGLFMVTGGISRRRRMRAQSRHRVRRAERDVEVTHQTAEDLAAENTRLRAQLEREHEVAATMGGVTVPPGTGDVPYGDQVTDAVHKDVVDPYPEDRMIDVTSPSESRSRS